MGKSVSPLFTDRTSSRPVLSRTDRPGQCSTRSAHQDCILFVLLKPRFLANDLQEEKWIPLALFLRSSESSNWLPLTVAGRRYWLPLVPRRPSPEAQVEIG